jgi:nitronate monooxygenase
MTFRDVAVKTKDKREPSTKAMSNALRTPVCDVLGCKYPVVLAGMGGVSRSELVAAVMRAGGFGFLGMVREPPALIEREVARVRQLTVGSFGVNLIPAATPRPLLDAQIATFLALAIPAIALFWDIQPDIVRRVKNAGVIVFYQVGSVEDARQAEEAGADILIAQGRDAGGHVRGNEPLVTLVPHIVAASRLPVLAAGGIMSGRDLVEVLSLGAQGAVIGTALMATHESFAHDYHKQRLVEARDGDTLLTCDFHINWPEGAKVRVLNNSVTRGERGDPNSDIREVIGDEEGRPIYLFSTDSPLRTMSGDLEAMALYAGGGVGRLHSIVGAEERVRSIISEAAVLLESRGP